MRYAGHFFLLTLLLNTDETDITPLTPSSTSSQLVLGAEASGQGWTLAKMQRLTLLGGALSAIGASQAAGNLNVSSLLRSVADSSYRPYGRLPSRIPAAYVTETTVAGPGHWDRVREFHRSRRLCPVRLRIQLRQRRRCNAMSIPGAVGSRLACRCRGRNGSRLQHPSIQRDIRGHNGRTR